MAVTVTPNLTTLFTANTSFGGQTTYSGFQRFGSACNGLQVGNETIHITGTVTSFNLTGNAIYVWLLGPASIGTLSQGGFRIIIGDGSNTRAYFVGGRDTPAFRASGWDCYVLHGDSLPTGFTQLQGSAQPNLNNLTTIGVGFTNTAKATGNSPNCFFDVCRYGTGLTIVGDPNDPGSFLDVALLDASIQNAWGIVREIDTSVYGCQGRLTFGSISEDSTFEEFNTYLVYESRLVPEDFYKLIVLGDDSFNNIFKLGNKTGQGEDSTGVDGVTILSNVGLELDLSDERSETLIYGSTIVGSNQGITLPNSSDNEFITNVITNGGELFLGNTFSRNLRITSSTLLLDDSTDIANTEFNGASGGHGILITDQGTYDFNNLTFNNYGDDDTTDAAIFNDSGGEVIINIFGGNTPTVRNGSGATTIINNPITFIVNNIIEDSEVRIFTQSDLTELGGVESVSDTPIDVNNVSVESDPDNTDRFRVIYNYNHEEDIPIYLVVFKQTRIPIYQSLNLTDQDSSFFAVQIFDRQFEAGSGI